MAPKSKFGWFHVRRSFTRNVAVAVVAGLGECWTGIEEAIFTDPLWAPAPVLGPVRH